MSESTVVKLPQSSKANNVTASWEDPDQSDQSLRYPHEESLSPKVTHWAHSEDSDQSGQMAMLIWVYD